MILNDIWMLPGWFTTTDLALVGVWAGVYVAGLAYVGAVLAVRAIRGWRQRECGRRGAGSGERRAGR